MFCGPVFVLSVLMLGIAASYHIRDSNLRHRRSTLDTDIDNIVETDIKIVPRDDWGARQPAATTKLKTPVPYVVIHHTFKPAACHTRELCDAAMRSMQDFHMDGRGWWDIGYNFCVGSDGIVYEGRGWKILGAHALHFNTVSLGICLIGNWNETLPPENQMKMAQELIEFGVSQGLIQETYKLVGHRQVRETECPGAALFHNLQTWPHYSEFPRTVADLSEVDELPESSKETIRNKTQITLS